MKREGWQHGTTVRIFSRNKLLRVVGSADDEAVAAGAVAKGKKAQPKPTNASKSTGKSSHHSATKARRDKAAKGAHKLRACDVALNHRLVSWRVVDGGGVGIRIPDYKATSASSLLSYLAGSGNSWHEDDDGDGSLEAAPPAADGGLSDLYDLSVGRRRDNNAAPAGAPQEADLPRATDIVLGDTDAIEEQQKQDADDGGNEDEDEDVIGFCMVSIEIAVVEFSDCEGDWILVDDI